MILILRIFRDTITNYSYVYKHVGYSDTLGDKQNINYLTIKSVIIGT